MREGRPDSLGEKYRGARFGRGQYDSEFFATEPTNDSELTRRLAKYLPKPFDDSIPHLMAVGIIDLLEAIDVTNKNCHRKCRTGPLEYWSRTLEEASTIENSRKRICHRLLGQILHQVCGDPYEKEYRKRNP